MVALSYLWQFLWLWFTVGRLQPGCRRDRLFTNLAYRLSRDDREAQNPIQAFSGSMINPAFRHYTPHLAVRHIQVHLIRGEPAPTEVGTRLELPDFLRESLGSTGFVFLQVPAPDFFNTRLLGRAAVN